MEMSFIAVIGGRRSMPFNLEMSVMAFIAGGCAVTFGNVCYCSFWALSAFFETSVITVIVLQLLAFWKRVLLQSVPH